MEEAVVDRTSPRWRAAVWGIRTMGVSLAIVVVGLVVRAVSDDASRAILAAGIGLYVATFVFTIFATVLAYGEIPSPRPGFLEVRRVLLRDVVRGRPRDATDPSPH